MNYRTHVKYINGYFRNELVEATVKLIRNQQEMKSLLQWVTSVPSLRRPELVKSFAERVATELGLPYMDIIVKCKNTQMQKHMENSYQQSKNAYEGFSINDECLEGAVLLIDDMIDSGWTFTVCGMLLKRAGSGDVYPFALASTSKLEGGE